MSCLKMWMMVDVLSADLDEIQGEDMDDNEIGNLGLRLRAKAWESRMKRRRLPRHANR
jgi:hypothetical protein